MSEQGRVNQIERLLIDKGWSGAKVFTQMKQVVQRLEEKLRSKEADNKELRRQIDALKIDAMNMKTIKGGR